MARNWRWRSLCCTLRRASYCDDSPQGRWRSSWRQWVDRCPWRGWNYFVRHFFLKAAHVTRTRRFHQITASSLHVLRQKAYNHYKRNLEEDENLMSVEEWLSHNAETSPSSSFGRWSCSWKWMWWSLSDRSERQIFFCTEMHLTKLFSGTSPSTTQTTLQKMLSRIYSKYWVKRCTHSDTK